MAKFITIPDGIQNRRGSDGSGFALGPQPADGTPLSKLNYTSVAGTDNIGSGFAAGDEKLFYLDNHGDGTITITTSAELTADANFVVKGRNADGAAVTETITIDISDNASEATGSTNFAGIYPITITPPDSFTPATAKWGATATTRAHTVTGGVRPYLYPVSNLDMNPVTETQESNLVGASGAAEPPELGRSSARLNFTTAALAEDLPYLLTGWFNNPVDSTEIATQSAGATVTVPANGNVPISMPSEGTTHPSKVKITFTAAPASGTLKISGYTKRGTKARDRKLREETITLGTETSYESKYYYTWDGDNALTITAANVGTAGDAAFVLDSELYSTAFQIADIDTQFRGFDVQGLVGGEPRTGRKIVPSQIDINSSPDGVEVAFQCPGAQVTARRTIQGGDAEERYIGANYLNVPKARLQGWSGALRYNDVLVKMTGLNIVLNRNYTPDPATDGGSTSEDLEANANRAITLSPTTRFQSSYKKDVAVTNWQELFEERERTRLNARWYHYTKYGQRRQMIVDAQSVGVVENVDQVVGGPGNIDVSPALQAFGTDDANEISITFLTQKSYSV